MTNTDATPAVTNDRKILDAWHERRRAVEDLKRVDHSHLSRVEADAADAVYIERIYACDATIMDTPADGFAGFAVKAKLSYAKNCDELGNESGDRTIPEGAHPLRDDALMARLANELERRAGVLV